MEHLNINNDIMNHVNTLKTLADMHNSFDINNCTEEELENFSDNVRNILERVDI